MIDGALFGRDADLARIDEFLDHLADGSAALVMAGDAGIGKTTLWQAALREAYRRGFRVLVARPAESEARLAYSGLGDLLDLVADEVLPALPEPQRRALAIALLKVGDDQNPPDQRAVSVAVLAALRILSSMSSVLLAIDDVQWLDHSSGRVLNFVVRRLGPAPIGVVATLRVGPGLVEPLGLAGGIDGGRFWHVGVGPLSVAALQQVVATEMGAALAHRTVARLHRASGGNPFYALELARALRGREDDLVPGQPLPVPQDLRALVGGRLEGLADDVRQVVLVVAALSQPTTATVGAVIGPQAVAGVMGALQEGVIHADGDRLRLAHPLLGSVAYYMHTAEQRRWLHERIAGVLGDAEERARHLALAAAGPDAAVAAALDDAARAAAGRGAPDAVAELSELACRLTPPQDLDEARRRAVMAAICHYAVGDWKLAHTQLEGIIVATTPGPARAVVLRTLGEMEYFNDSRDAIRVLDQALAEAGADDILRASIELYVGFVIITTSGDAVAAGAYADAAVDRAERVGEVGLLAASLAVAGFVDFVAGRAGAEARIERAIALKAPDRPGVMLCSPGFLAGWAWGWTERQDAARIVLDGLYKSALDRGAESALPLLGFFATHLACRTGDLDGAARYARTSLETSAYIGGDVSVAAGLAAQALVAAYSGDADAARQQAHDSVGLFQRSGWHVPSTWPAWTLGFVELSLNDAAAAHRVLGPLNHLLAAAGVAEPALAPSVPDDIEALVALGELDQAEALLGWLDERGRRLDRAWALATAARCRALLRAARGDLDGAATSAETSLVHLERFSSPLERGRTLFVQGQLERRRKHKAAARRTLEEALATFEAVGATLWATRASGELGRVGLRPPAPLELTATEAIVAELAASGLSTKKVAEQAFMSARSVEGVLARIYRKLGVASRAELANTMAARRSSPRGAR